MFLLIHLELLSYLLCHLAKEKWHT